MWDIEPPEYDAPRPAEPVLHLALGAPPPRTKTQHRSLVSAYTDKPLVLHVQDGVPGYIDPDTRAFWPAFAAEPVKTDAAYVSQSTGVKPHSFAAWTPLGASFYDFDVYEWFVVLLGSPAQADVIQAVPHVARVDTLMPEGGQMCAESLTEPAAATVCYVWVTGTRTACVAHRLIYAHGLRAFPGMMQGDVTTPVVRAQCTTLHGLRQCSMEDDLARCADAVTSSRVVAHTGSFSGMYELPRADVSRAALTWGMFAALQMSQRLFMREAAAALEPLTTLFEPLASYAQAVLDVQAARARAAAPRVALAYSSEQKPSVAQCEHALELFYWATIHADPASALCEPSTALLNLELYLRFGLLVVRRRAYHFHNGNKKRRKRKVDEE